MGTFKMKSPTVVSILLSQAAHANQANPFYNENCNDLDLGEECSEGCVQALVDCVLECDYDDTCVSGCAREEAVCIDSCPCHADCFDGCDDCEHPICNQCLDAEANEDYKTCELDLEATLQECLAGCTGDSSCVLGCSNYYATKLADCPCTENCPNGCPCDSYDCNQTTTTTTTERTTITLPTRPPTDGPTDGPTDEPPETTTTEPSEAQAVFMLYSKKSPNFQKIMTDGSVIDMNFTIGDDTEVYDSCSVVYLGHMYIFGGDKKTKQISEIKKGECSLNRIGDLDFDMNTGTCGVFNLEGRNDDLILCFPESKDKMCKRFDGNHREDITDPEQWTELASSRYHHKRARLGHYKGQPFITGSRSSDNKHT